MENKHPYTDSAMRYDMANHRYILEVDHVRTALNINLEDVLEAGGSADRANAARVFLDRVSRTIYAYILSATPTPRKRERDLALCPEYRAALRVAMEEQAIYTLNNGELGAWSGVNLDTGAVIDRAAIRAAEIAPRAEDVLIAYGVYSPAFSRFAREIVPRYEEEGY